MRIKNMLIAVLVIGGLFVCLVTVAHAQSDRRKVPRVAYIEPDNDTVIDLSGKKSLTFRWKQQPIPGGGRAGFRFKLCKGFGYDFIVSEDTGPDVLSIDVPADKFEDGAMYSWYVEQRDGSSTRWSLHDSWSFKVFKR